MATMTTNGEVPTATMATMTMDDDGERDVGHNDTDDDNPAQTIATTRWGGGWSGGAGEGKGM